jgi:hypothetical protein
MFKENHANTKCRAVKPDGTACQAHAISTSRFCFFHDPASAEKRNAARQAGGESRAREIKALPPETPDCRLRLGVNHIQKRYFRGEPILYAEQETILNASLRRLEDLLLAYRICILDTRTFPPGPESGEQDPTLITAEELLHATRPAIASWLIPLMQEAGDGALNVQWHTDTEFAS